MLLFLGGHPGAGARGPAQSEDAGRAVPAARALAGRPGRRRAPDRRRGSGIREPVTDAAWGFTPTDFLNYLQRTDQTPTRYERLRSGQPPGVTFWYRQSPVALSTDSFVAGGTVNLNNPPVRVAGMVNVMLDLKGRLHFLQAVPARVQDSDAPAAAPDWAALLREAGFDVVEVHGRRRPHGCRRSSAMRARRGPASTRIGRTFPSASRPQPWRGQPVYFQIFEPWSGTTLGVPAGRPRVTAGGGVRVPALLRRRRSARSSSHDATFASTAATRSGAFRLALVLCLMHVVAGLMTAHLTYDVVPTLLTVGLLIGRGLLLGMVVYAIYMALEPDVRRRWPETLIAWSRVLSGPIEGPAGRPRPAAGHPRRRRPPPADAAVAASAGVARSGAGRVGAVSGLRRQPAGHDLGDPEQQRRRGADRHDACADLLPAVPRRCGGGCWRWARSARC